MSWKEPTTAGGVGHPELLPQLLGDVRLALGEDKTLLCVKIISGSDLTPAHVGEEDEEQGDGEQGLVQDGLEGDHSDGAGHRVPCVQPAVP